MKTLDRMEKEAISYGKFHSTYICSEEELEMKNKFTAFSGAYVRSLIHLIRKKDEYLELIESNDDAYRPGYSSESYARAARKLTENLE